MSSKFLLLVLGICLLVQSSLGKALPSAEDSTEQTVDATKDATEQPVDSTEDSTEQPVDSTEDSTEQTDDSTEDPITWDMLGTPKKTFFFYVLVEFSKVADTALTTGKKVLQDVIADVSALDDKNEEITAKLEEYSKLVAQIEKLQTEDNSHNYIDKIELMVELGDLLEKTNVTLIENPTRVDELFGESFAKNGLEDLDEEVTNKFDEVFSEDFFDTTDKILNSVTSEEWPERNEIKDWLKKFNAEDDPEKKSNMFDELIALL